MQGPRSRRLSLAAGAGLASALVLAACGSSSPSGGSTGTSAGPHFTGVVHFAAVAPITGFASPTGLAILNGAKAAAYIINKDGGILGKKLVIDPADTKGDPADAVTPTLQEITLNHPAAFIGPIALTIQSVKPIFDRYKIPDAWQGGASEFDSITDPYLWHFVPSDTQEGVAIAAYARSKGYTRAAMLFATSSGSQSFEPIIASTFKKLGGTIVATESVTPDLSSYLSEAEAIIKAHPQVIFTQMDPGTEATAFKDFEQLSGLKIPFIGTDIMAANQANKAIGPKISAAHLVSVEPSTALAGSGQAFAQAYEKVAHTVPQAGGANAYDGTIDIALAITKAKSFAGPKIIQQMDAVSNPPGIAVTSYAQGVKDILAGKKINYQGISGPIDFDQHHLVTGPWSVVQATGDAAGDVKTIETITAAQVEGVLQGKPLP